MWKIQGKSTSNKIEKPGGVGGGVGGGERGVSKTFDYGKESRIEMIAVDRSR